MAKYCLDLTVAAIEPLTAKYFLLRLTHADPLPVPRPGQFVEVRVDGSPATFLRRPISINHFDPVRNELWLLVAKVGDGTRRLSQLSAGDTVNCLLPLGNGFSMPSRPDERRLLVGGGVGVAPLLYLGEKMAEAGCRPTYLLGARTAADLLEMDLFRRTGDVYVTTEDGTAGERGFVTGHTLLGRERFDRILCCGPGPMMRAVARYAAKADTGCEVSLENQMACGLGACLCCVEKTVEGNLCVCKDGPVFDVKQLLWQL